MKVKYQDFKFRQATLNTIDTVNDIISDYQSQGYDMTLRQIYYQLVSKDLIENSTRSYDSLGVTVNNGRLAGLIDWDAIVDRTRLLRGRNHYLSVEYELDELSSQYYLDKWSNQAHHVEVWVEKDALIGVVGDICRKLDVNYFSCRGYTSQTAMYKAARRLKYYESQGKENVILHLGDHDPSGIDMSRDIVERLEMFGATIDFRRIALNMEQIGLYNPPPNPAKLSDTRAKGYIENYGKSSWELDALKPTVLDELIRSNIKPLVNKDLRSEILKREIDAKVELERISTNYGDVLDYLSSLDE